MKLRIIAVIFPILLANLNLSLLHAANHVVELGQSIQSKVNLAQSGDVVIIREATYNNQTVDINRSIRLVREKGTNITIGGTITVRDVNQTGVLRDFVINATGGGRVNIQNCANYGLENLTGLPQGITVSGSKVILRDCLSTSGLTISGASRVEVVNSSFNGTLSISGSSSIHAHNSEFGTFNATDSNVTFVDSNASTTNITRGKARLHGSKFGHVTFNGCDWEGHDSWFTGNLYSINSHSKLFRSSVWSGFDHQTSTYNGEDLDCVVYQSYLRDHGYFRGKRTWVAYSYVGQAYPYSNHAQEAYFIGNTIRYRIFPHGPSTSLSRSLNLYVNNNLFSQAKILPTDQTHTNKSSFTLTKKLTALQPTLVSHVRNKLHGAECIVGFSYLDGTEANSTKIISVPEDWKGFFRYANPNPGKKVTDIKIYLKNITGGNGDEKETFINNKYSVSNFRVTYPAPESTYNYPTIWVHWDNNGNDKLQSAHIVNNIFDNPGSRSSQYMICLYNGTVNGAFIHGNVFRRNTGFSIPAIYAPKGADRFIGDSPVPAPDICSHNYFQDITKAVTGGLVSEENFTGADPGFIDPAGGDYRLKSDSILVDKGPAEPHFNDRNGSRNDVGIFGGQNYDPSGNYTNFPVILTTQQSTNLISSGSTTPFIINARAAVATE